MRVLRFKDITWLNLMANRSYTEGLKDHENAHKKPFMSSWLSINSNKKHNDKLLSSM